MISVGPVSPTTAYWTLLSWITATTPPPLMPAAVWSQRLLAPGTTTYGRVSARSGLPSDWWKAVSGWNQGSVSSLHFVVAWPSQSMSMSAFQNTAPFLPHTGTVAGVSRRCGTCRGRSACRTSSWRAGRPRRPSPPGPTRDAGRRGRWRGAAAVRRRAGRPPGSAVRASVRRRTVKGTFRREIR